jgi:hypothetical protein
MSKRMTLGTSLLRPELDELLQKANEHVSQMTSEEMQGTLAAQALSWMLGEMLLSIDEAEPPVREQRTKGVLHLLKEIDALIEGEIKSLTRPLPLFDLELRIQALSLEDRKSFSTRVKSEITKLSKT